MDRPTSVSHADQRTARTAPWNQLRWWLVIAFVSLTILPIAVVVPLTFNQVRTQVTAQAIDQLGSITDLKIAQITRWIGDSHALLSITLSNPVVAQIDPILTTIEDETQREGINRLLQQLITQDNTASEGLFSQLFIYDRAGNVIAASDPSQIGKIVQRQPYFAASLDQPFTQAPYYAVGSGELTMLVTRPIRSLDGSLNGVLAGQLNLNTLGNFMLERSGLGLSGETYLVSAENNYLLTPSRFAGYPINRSYRSQGIDLGLQQQNGSGVYGDYRDPPVPVIGVYRWVPELQAVFLAEIDQAEIAQRFAATIQLIGLVALLAAAGAVGFGFFVATRIADPLSRLTATALQITNGDFSQRTAEGRGSSEIRLLTTTFNRMATQLQETLSGLEQRVADRTRALEQVNQEQERVLAALHASLQERDALSATIRELSSPVLPVADNVLVMPLIGVIDSQRASDLVTTLLEAIERNRARMIILDVTGVPVIDTQTARLLIQAADASRLLGAQPILVGIRPELAQTIVGLGVDLSDLQSMADLQSALRYALQRN
ncbi:MAG: HAMP domain-containing protein [Oscillochloris sp.]|nr:HAMP domain-containing protein [Oscillochloris sp.]